MTSAKQATVVGVALAAAAVAVYASSDSPAPGKDSRQRFDVNLLAVHPFAVDSSQTALRDLRDAIQDLVAAEFPGGDGGPRAVDPTVTGAGQVLHGTVSGTPNELAIETVVSDASTRVPRARALVRGSADSIPYLAEQLAARLLAIQAARDSDELAAFRRTSPSAFRAYLAGVNAHRLGRAGIASEAMLHFERALFLDSTFTLAALRLAEMAAVYGTSERDELWKFETIWNHRDRLGAADRAMLAAYLGPRYPKAPSLAELIAAAERATVTAPARAEAWHVLGEHLVRYASKIGRPRWETQAQYALSRAYTLDSTDASTLAYLLLLAVRSGDSSAVRQYAALHSALDPVGQQAQFTEFYRWLSYQALGDGAGLTAVRGRFDRMPRGSLRAIIDWSQTLGAGLDDGERAKRRFIEGASEGGYRRAVTVAIVPYLLNRGRPNEASRLLATAERGFGQRVDVGTMEFRIYAALFWDADSSEAASAAASLEAYIEGGPLQAGQARDRATAACALAHWRVALGDHGGAKAALARMRRLLRSSPTAPAESMPICAASVEAQLASAERSPTAAAALARLDSLLSAGFDVQLLLPTVASLIAARLYEVRGDRLQALARTRRRAFWWNQLLSTQLHEEGRLASMVGEDSSAIRAYRHYLALRSDPEPHLLPKVARVRQELARLTRQ